MGVTVRGVDLRSDDLDDPEAWDVVYKAFLDHGLLVFEGQFGITRDQELETDKICQMKRRCYVTTGKLL